MLAQLVMQCSHDDVMPGDESVLYVQASIKPATHQRLGADYLAGENKGQWNIGSQAIFIHAVVSTAFCAVSKVNLTYPDYLLFVWTLILGTDALQGYLPFKC